jgi:proline iminopeptidase
MEAVMTSLRFDALPWLAMLALGASPLACSTYDGGEYFFVSNDGVTMPVWVKGNVDSGRFIVFLHGGPGDSGILLGCADFFDEIQERSAMVFFDQRVAGMSQGDPSVDDLNLDQMVDDLDVVIDVIRQRYDVEQVALMGESWGGTLGTAYLVDESRQRKVSVWIDVDGDHDMPYDNELSRQWVMDTATARLEAGDEPERWRSVLDWYDAHPVITPDLIVEHSGYVNEAGGYYYDPANEPEIPTDLMFESPLSMFTMGATMAALFAHIDTPAGEALMSTDLSEEMGRLTIPTLLLWGRHDGAVPIAMGQDAYDRIGTDEADKELVIFEQSAHSPDIEETEAFNETVNRFLEAHP